MPDKRAKKAMEDARKAVNARDKTIAIQECLLRHVIEPASEDPLFVGDPSGWPTAKAVAYDKMIDELNSLPDSDFDTPSDKDLVRKFLTEQIGIEGAKYEMRKLAQAEKADIPEDDFRIFHGPSVVNIVAFPTAQRKRCYAAEAKGGSSQPKGDQGTMKNLEKEAKKMKNSKYNSKKKLPNETDSDQEKRVKKERDKRVDTGFELEKQINDDNVTFITTSTAYDEDEEKWAPSTTKEAK